MITTEIFDSRYKKLHIKPGSSKCPGCCGLIHDRYILEAINESGKNVIMKAYAGCGGGTLSPEIPHYGMNFSSGPDVAAGVALALEVLGKSDIVVICGNGDGHVSDISFNKTSACAERNENMIQYCVDNEAYMNTGIQKSGSTPIGAWTTTTPWGKKTNKKYLPMIMAQHRIPYVATLSIAYPKEFKNSFKKALEMKGYRYLHILMPCPTGWRYPSQKGIKVATLSVQTWMWPLYEVENGVFKLMVKPKPKPVKEYLELQGRFKDLSEEDIQNYQKDVDRRRMKLLEDDGKNILY